MMKKAVVALLFTIALGGSASLRELPPHPPLAMDYHAAFVFYDTQTPAGKQTLRLAQVSPPIWNRETFQFNLARFANVRMTLATLPGATGNAMQGPFSYNGLVTSPTNRFVAVQSFELGVDFIDRWISVYDQQSGALVSHFNTHNFSNTHRANCDSPKFDAFLATEKASGVPAAQLAMYDYKVSLEGSDGSNIVGPDTSWTPQETLLVRYTMRISGPLSALDSFEFEMAPDGGLSLTPLSCNAGKPHWARPYPAPFSIATSGRIRYLHHDLPFYPLRGIAVRGASFIQASEVSGNVT